VLGYSCNGSALEGSMSNERAGPKTLQSAKPDGAYEVNIPYGGGTTHLADVIDAESKRFLWMFAAQYLAQFVGVPIVPCETCHGPTPNIRTFVVIIDGEDELGTCPACGRLTDDEGECLVPLRADGTEGEPRIVRIRPDSGATEPPEMP